MQGQPCVWVRMSVRTCVLVNQSYVQDPRSKRESQNRDYSRGVSRSMCLFSASAYTMLLLFLLPSLLFFSPTSVFSQVERRGGHKSSGFGIESWNCVPKNEGTNFSMVKLESGRWTNEGEMKKSMKFSFSIHASHKKTRKKMHKKEFLCILSFFIWRWKLN